MTTTVVAVTPAKALEVDGHVVSYLITPRITTVLFVQVLDALELAPGGIHVSGGGFTPTAPAVLTVTPAKALEIATTSWEVDYGVRLTWPVLQALELGPGSVVANYTVQLGGRVYVWSQANQRMAGVFCQVWSDTAGEAVGVNTLIWYDSEGRADVTPVPVIPDPAQ